MYLQFLGRFFMYPDPDFQDRIWIFWPILIRTQEKSLIQIRTKGPWSETLNKRCHHSPVEQCWPPPGPGSGTVFPALVSLKHNSICNTQKVLKTIKSKAVMWILIHDSCIRIQKFAPILTRFRIRIRAVSHGYMINFISTIYYLKTIFLKTKQYKIMLHDEISEFKRWIYISQSSFFLIFNCEGTEFYSKYGCGSLDPDPQHWSK